MTNKQAGLLAGATITVVIAICVVGLMIAKRLELVTQEIGRQTQKCMLGDDR